MKTMKTIEDCINEMEKMKTCEEIGEREICIECIDRIIAKLKEKKKLKFVKKGSKYTSTPNSLWRK